MQNIELKEINLKNEHHKRHILKLAKDNNFQYLNLTFILDERFSSLISKNLHEMKGYLALINYKPIGFILSSHLDIDDTNRIEFLLVNENYRNKGVGKLLIQKILKDCEVINQIVHIEIDQDTPILFYAKIGFTVHERRYNIDILKYNK